MVHAATKSLTNFSLLSFATNAIEILNDYNQLAYVAASAAFIQNQAAVRASAGAPINAEAIITAIPETLAKLLKR